MRKSLFFQSAQVLAIQKKALVSRQFNIRFKVNFFQYGY